MKTHNKMTTRPDYPSHIDVKAQCLSAQSGADVLGNMLSWVKAFDSLL